jgi:uncharacterized DUF497 family protein
MRIQNPPYDWDEDKRTLNVQRHKVDFIIAEAFEWESALTFVDDRQDYGELREVAWGFIGHRLYVLVYTQRGKVIRIISLRKADPNESRDYAKQIR